MEPNTDSSGGGGMGGMFGAIFGTIDKSKDTMAAKEAAETSKFFIGGKYTKQQTQDMIIFFALVFILALVLFFFRKK